MRELFLLREERLAAISDVVAKPLLSEKISPNICRTELRSWTSAAKRAQSELADLLFVNRTPDFFTDRGRVR